MLVSTTKLLSAAQEGGYAIGAFNVYNLEGVQAVVAASESESSPAILQLHPASFAHGGKPLVGLCLSAATAATVPMSVHLDHSSSADQVMEALEAGLTSVMGDGSELEYEDNVEFTRRVAELAHVHDGVVEAELGRLAGTEDDLTIPENRAKLTDPNMASDFVARTKTDILAVCIGNVHGHYSGEPHLDFERLDAIRKVVSVPLVLHGASGLSDAMVRRSIELGVCKLNVNTEVREAYLESLKRDLNALRSPDLVPLMQNAVVAMQEVVSAKLRLFGSTA